MGWIKIATVGLSLLGYGALVGAGVWWFATRERAIIENESIQTRQEQVQKLQGVDTEQAKAESNERRRKAIEAAEQEGSIDDRGDDRWTAFLNRLLD